MASPLDDTFLAPNCSHPLDLIDTLNFTTQTYCLFLDLDGTLAAFQDNPQHSFIPPATLQLLQHCIEQATPVIAVTGRDLTTAEKLLASVPIPIAGLHGLDIKIDAKTLLCPDLSAINFDQLKQQISKACALYPDLLIEDKGHAIALHYRQCPALAETAEQIMRDLQPEYPQLKLHQGKCVVELLPLQASKGYAIKTLMQNLQLEEWIPIFIGDDRTDEPGFAVVNALQGISIKVGSGATEAHHRLQDISAVAQFLELFVQQLKARVCSKNRASEGEQACLN